MSKKEFNRNVRISRNLFLFLIFTLFSFMLIAIFFPLLYQSLNQPFDYKDNIYPIVVISLGLSIFLTILTNFIMIRRKVWKRAIR